GAGVSGFKGHGGRPRRPSPDSTFGRDARDTWDTFTRRTPRRDDAHSGSTGDLTSERSVAILSGRACQMAASATVRRRSPVVKVFGYRLSRRRLLPLLGAAAAIGPIARALAAHSAGGAPRAHAAHGRRPPGHPPRPRLSL